MVRQAIRAEGDHAVACFLRLVIGGRASDDQKQGDAVIPVDDGDYYVEIKECHAAFGGPGTINQIRAIKYTPLVIQAPERRCWYVVPASELVRLAAQKERGQHTEIPFECMNLALAQLEDRGFECSDQDLSSRVMEAVRIGKREDRLRVLMGDLLQAIRELGEEYKKGFDLAETRTRAPTRL